MALQIYISHTGHALVFAEQGGRLDGLRAWIETNAGIPLNRQILMTGRGKNVKNLASESEIFVYDKEFLSPDSKPPSRRGTDVPQLREVPSLLSNENSLPAWQELFMSRRAWALEACEIVRAGVESVEGRTSETEVIARSLKVALENLRNLVTHLQQKFESTQQWAQECLQEHREVLADWQAGVDTLAELSVREDVAHILRRAPEEDEGGQTHGSIGTLVDLVRRDLLQTAAASVDKSSADFGKRLGELESAMEQLKRDAHHAQSHQIDTVDTDTNALLDEAETLAKRISSDYEDVLQLQDTPKSLAPTSRKAAVHTRELLPALQSVVDELRQTVTLATSRQNEAVHTFYMTLQAISGVQSRLGELQSRIAGLDFHDNDHLQQLTRVFQLPMVYGSVLAEATRRSEWTERMRLEVEGLQEDISQRTEEEQRRRRKWASSYNEFLNDELNAKDTLIDLKASTSRNAWPFVRRDEIFAWIDDLRALGLDDAVQSITQRLKDLDAPVRKPKPKTFKNGSVHDLSQSATLRHGDELRSLQDEKLRLEDKLRASDSRVRKLEDLLHRQSQLSRPPSGTFVPGAGPPDFERRLSSPSPLIRQSDLSRRSSVSLRRLSNTQDEKALVQKIVALEGQVQKLQEEAHAERRSSSESRDKMREAESVKRDLMANFEAQRQEFEDERQLLEDENHKLKVKLEEAEDELDRVLGSRDHLKFTQDQIITNLRTELEQTRQSLTEQLAQSTRKADSSHKEVVTQRERVGTLERQLHQLKEERAAAQSQNMTLANRLRSMEEQQQEYISSLQGAHANLSPAGSAPDDLRRLVNALEILSEGAAIHARGLDDSLQLATAENKSLEEKVAHAESQIKVLTERLATAEAKSGELREGVHQERSKLSALRSELADERAELHNLRAKFAAGETGSDALKERLKSEEQKVAELMERRVDDEGIIQKLQYEVENVTRDAHIAAERQAALQQHLDHRGEKARQLSERLFHHHDRIIRMLEQFGYLVSRQDDTLVIQRASKVNASTTLSGGEGGGSSAMKRTISGSSPAQHYSDPADVETLYWTSDADVSNEEAKYQSFVGALQRLDVDSTIDLITKRYKDVETLAKKYQKDSRAYREKSHRLQSEAHDKIAYRTFKEGDLALFLPTRNQATRPWAAFNVGAPHYFLREQDVHKLQTRDWLLARITKIEERVVDLSRSLRGNASTTEASDGASARSVDDENPFELSDGLRWYMIDASEEKPGAPGTPSVGKSTVTASNIEVKGHVGRKDKSSGGGGGNAVMVAKTLTKSLDSRRNSSASKQSVNLRAKGEGSSVKDSPTPLALIASDTDGPVVIKPSAEDARATGQTAREDARVFDVVRRDLLLGP